VDITSQDLILLRVPRLLLHYSTADNVSVTVLDAVIPTPDDVSVPALDEVSTPTSDLPTYVDEST